MATVDDVLTIAPELVPLSTAELQAALDLAALLVSPDAFTGAYDRAHALLAAHYASEGNTRLGASASTGELSSITVGPVSKTFNTSGGGVAGRSSSTPHGSTRYGRAFDALVAVLFGGPEVAL